MVFVDKIVTGAFVSGNDIKAETKEEKPFMNPPEEVEAEKAEEVAEAEEPTEKPKKRGRKRAN